LNAETTRKLLEDLKSGNVTTDEALQRLVLMPYENVNGFANLDHHRALRTGSPEVIFAQGKTPEQVIEIFKRLSEQNDQVLATRVSNDMYQSVKDHLPDATYHPAAHLFYLDRDQNREKKSGILVLSAGTADIPVAEEAAITAELSGNRVDRYYDVGISGLHRILDKLPQIQSAHVIIAVAGMEGALPSVVGGLTSAPVIAVPTSIGYGASFNGLAALLAMLNSCANGVAVVNIDNGFGAGCIASRINALANKE
jgi:pyridinium-3,5-biscarboxylic acid mononucleotide synthase